MLKTVTLLSQDLSERAILQRAFTDDVEEMILVTGSFPITRTANGISNLCLDMERINPALMTKFTRAFLGETGLEALAVVPMQVGGLSIPGQGRLHVSAFLQRGAPAIFLRASRPFQKTLQDVLPGANLDACLAHLSYNEQVPGVYVVAGKVPENVHAVLAALVIDSAARHGQQGAMTMTIEHPLRFLIPHSREQVVLQREVGIDVESFLAGIKQAELASLQGTIMINNALDADIWPGIARMAILGTRFLVGLPTLSAHEAQIFLAEQRSKTASSCTTSLVQTDAVSVLFCRL
ncbi:hypothetical protein HAP94_06170 [Acidithiobacillus ferrivorans]|nr:hypothetical protein [Acidithiobacillus ferrivorans]